MKLKHYFIGIIIILIDQLSKYLMINKNITIIPNLFEFNYTENTGGAFGIGTKSIITLLSIAIIIGIIIFLIKGNNKLTNYVPYILVIAGSLGNLIDRIFKGFVIDFIDIDILNFPNFNISDIFIVLGIILISTNEIKYINKYKHTNKVKGDNEMKKRNKIIIITTIIVLLIAAGISIYFVLHKIKNEQKISLITNNSSLINFDEEYREGKITADEYVKHRLEDDNQDTMQIYLGVNKEAIATYNDKVLGFDKIKSKFNGVDYSGSVMLPYVIMNVDEVKDNLEYALQVTNHELFHHYQCQIFPQEYGRNISQDIVILNLQMFNKKLMA